MKHVTLSRSERIVAVVPEKCSGPGWTNELVHIHIVDNATGAYRHESLRLSAGECSDGMMRLHKIGALVCAELMSEVSTNYKAEVRT